jgi:REP element-mobilizing transposase RayT
MEQMGLRFPRAKKRGGKREGAGRKRTRPGRRAPHRARPRHNHAHPVHVTLRVRRGLPTLRHEGLHALLRKAIHGASRSPAVGVAFRVVEFSIQDDHAHFIIEAHDKDTLSRGMRGLAIRLARAFNRGVGVRGAVWGDRYDARDLKTPREVRNAIVYVLMNAKKHHHAIDRGIDTFSSAPWFRGFAVAIASPHEESPVVMARTWLANVGWRRRGLVRRDERPLTPD